MLAIDNMLKEWQIEDKISAICCDTTSVNTGSKIGICKQLRDKYNNDILTIPCRHHIMELLLSKAYSIALNINPSSYVCLSE